MFYILNACFSPMHKALPFCEYMSHFLFIILGPVSFSSLLLVLGLYLPTADLKIPLLVSSSQANKTV